MKKSLLLLVLFAIALASWRYKINVVKLSGDTRLRDIRTQKPNVPQYTLTEKDRKFYILSVDQHKVSKPRDTVIYYKKGYYLSVPLKLSNNSDDTLKYINMSCSSYEIFQTDDINISVTVHPCDSNFPVVFTIAPHKSSTIIIHVMSDNIAVNAGTKFRLGMHLQKYLNKQVGFASFDKMRKSTKNIIWSNAVQIPVE